MARRHESRVSRSLLAAYGAVMAMVVVIGAVAIWTFIEKQSLVINPEPLPKITKSLKGITAKRANSILGLTGKPFWQEESYDHLVRNETEFDRIRDYIERNPVRAGLVREARQYRWSSAGWAAGGPRCVGRGP